MPRHVVVDGSNLATEGRPHPSLTQLNEAVLAYIAEHPEALVTVVVDATFGHRIDPREVAEFDEAVANNELVAPPAGAIGRGDAFVLAVANRVNAVVLSNDSFQEFHGQYPWLFDEGRLVGGKPVPHVGWVFVERLPVRGPVSRSAVKKAKQARPSTESATVRVGSADASKPMPVPSAPPPGPARGRKSQPAAATNAAPAAPAAAAAPAPAASAPKGASAVNEPSPFLSFVAQHPLGTSVNAVVESYSSHGAYVRIGEVRGYVPLRLMHDPAPRSAREFMKIGDAVTLVVESYAPDRRSIDLATPAMASHRAEAPVAEPPAAPEAVKPAKRSRAKKAAAPVEAAAAGAGPVEAAAAGMSDAAGVAAQGAVEAAAPEAVKPAKRSRAKKAAAPVEAAAAGVSDAAGVAAQGAVEAGAAEVVKPAKRSRAKKAAAPVEVAGAAQGAVEAGAAEVVKPAKRSRAKQGSAAAAAAPADDVAPADAPASPARRRRSR